MPTDRRITPTQTTTTVFADEFKCDMSYANWRPKGSGDWLLIYTLHGSGRFVSSEAAHHTRPGEVVLYYPDDAQDYSTAPSAGEWHLLWAHFVGRTHWSHLLRWIRLETGARSLQLPEGEVREKFQDALRTVIHFSQRSFPGAIDLAANALEEALLWCHVARSDDAFFRMDPRIRRVTEHLGAHPKAPLSLGELARHCGLSVSRFAYLFKRETCLSPFQFQERGRLQRAGQLLRLTDLTVAEVAREVGFEDPFYFSNRFHRFSGLSPTLFRAGKNP